MAFKPDLFLVTAQALLKRASSEADFRTVAGRAYYAAYGYMRQQICFHKNVTPQKMFGRSGRHTDVAKATVGSGSFKKITQPYNSLRVLRTTSDYIYTGDVSKADAEGAVNDATWILRELRRLSSSDFKNFPLTPPQEKGATP